MPDLKAKRPSPITNDSRRAGMLAFGTAVGLATMIAAAPSYAQSQDAAGLFTQEQADRGKRTFVIECGGCHGFSLADVLAEGESADTFYSYISTSMPWEDPGSLQPQQYADIVAFFLGELGFPEGDTELPPDRELMAQIDPSSADAASDDAGTAAPDASEPPADEAGAAAAPEGDDGDAGAADAPADAADEAATDTAAPAEDTVEGGTAAADSGAAPAASTDGWFTAEQAEQGRRDFTISCGGCHGGEMVEVFKGYATAHDYYRFISSAMPADAPGSLGTGQYVAIIAYLMNQVGFPAGDTELTSDRDVLGQIVPSEAPE